jgi:hypothetical protein
MDRNLNRNPITFIGVGAFTGLPNLEMLCVIPTVLLLIFASLIVVSMSHRYLDTLVNTQAPYNMLLGLKLSAL